MKKPHVFLGCSSEKLPIAHALKANLRGYARVRLWTRGIFKLSRSALESLENALPEFDAAIFVLAPDDLARIRARYKDIVRDNIVFELGLFVGALGRERTFFVVPEASPKLHLPTDLAGITYATYKEPRRRVALQEALRPAAESIAEALREIARRGRRRRTGLRIERADFFEAFDFGPYFDNAKTLTTFFIHSRRWREDNTEDIRSFLRRKDTCLTAILPQPKDAVINNVFRRNFEDGPQIPSFVEDACCYYVALQKEFPGRVRLLFVQNYPTYSFYQFDELTIVAMYPTTARKKGVPTFLVKAGSAFAEFVKDDIDRMLQSARTPTRSERRRFLSRAHHS